MFFSREELGEVQRCRHRRGEAVAGCRSLCPLSPQLHLPPFLNILDLGTVLVITCASGHCQIFSEGFLFSLWKPDDYTEVDMKDLQFWRHTQNLKGARTKVACRTLIWPALIKEYKLIFFTVLVMGWCGTMPGSFPPLLCAWLKNLNWLMLGTSGCSRPREARFVYM